MEEVALSRAPTSQPASQPGSMVRGAARRRLAVALGCILQDIRVKRRKSKGVTHPIRGQRDVPGSPGEAGLSLTGSVFSFFSSSAPGAALDPYSPCNKNCECQTDSFTPVCGADGVTYLSACFAGCNSTVCGFLRAREGGGRGQPQWLKPEGQAGVGSHTGSSLGLPRPGKGFPISRRRGQLGPSC